MAVGSQQRKMVSIEEHKPQPVLQSYLELLYLHFSHYCIHWISSILTLSKAMSNADPKRMRSKLYNLLPLEMRGGSSSDTTSHPLAMVLYRKNRGRMEEVVAEEEEEEEAKRVSFEGRR
ncbi:hypothetical protein BHE74_00039497 [Ensete ventricosum]|nr:hypothetical protein BHE74_00039497 [Ensete ventricosum]